MHKALKVVCHQINIKKIKIKKKNFKKVKKKNWENLIALIYKEHLLTNKGKTISKKGTKDMSRGNQSMESMPELWTSEDPRVVKLLQLVK